MKQLSQDERREIQSVLREAHNTAIAELNAADPGWQKRVEDRKNKVAIGRLKVEKEVVELQQVEDQIRELERKRDSINARIVKKMPLGKRERYSSCPSPKDLCTAIAEIAEEMSDAEMAKDATGKRALIAKKELANGIAKLAKCSTREDVVASGILK